MGAECNCTAGKAVEAAAIKLSGESYLAVKKTYCLGPYGGCGWARFDPVSGYMYPTEEAAIGAAKYHLEDASGD